MRMKMRMRMSEVHGQAQQLREGRVPQFKCSSQAKRGWDTALLPAVLTQRHSCLPFRYLLERCPFSLTCIRTVRRLYRILGVETGTSVKERDKRVHRARGYINKEEGLESNVYDRTLLKKPLQTKQDFSCFFVDFAEKKFFISSNENLSEAKSFISCIGQ